MGLEQKQRMKDFAWQLSILTGDAESQTHVLGFFFFLFLLIFRYFIYSGIASPRAAERASLVAILQ